MVFCHLPCRVATSALDGGQMCCLAAQLLRPGTRILCAGNHRRFPQQFPFRHHYANKRAYDGAGVGYHISLSCRGLQLLPLLSLHPRHLFLPLLGHVVQHIHYGAGYMLPLRLGEPLQKQKIKISVKSSINPLRPADCTYRILLLFAEYNQAKSTSFTEH